MESIALLQCSRCQLRWVDNPRFTTCPFCRRHHVDGGQAFAVGVFYGSAFEAAGLEKLNLGERCPHGWMTWMLCKKCSQGN